MEGATKQSSSLRPPFHAITGGIKRQAIPPTPTPIFTFTTTSVPSLSGGVGRTFTPGSTVTSPFTAAALPLGRVRAGLPDLLLMSSGLQRVEDTVDLGPELEHVVFKRAEQLLWDLDGDGFGGGACTAFAFAFGLGFGLDSPIRLDVFGDDGFLPDDVLHLADLAGRVEGDGGVWVRFEAVHDPALQGLGVVGALVVVAEAVLAHADAHRGMYRLFGARQPCPLVLRVSRPAAHVVDQLPHDPEDGAVLRGEFLLAVFERCPHSAPSQAEEDTHAVVDLAESPWSCRPVRGSPGDTGSLGRDAVARWGCEERGRRSDAVHDIVGVDGQEIVLFEQADHPRQRQIRQRGVIVAPTDVAVHAGKPRLLEHLEIMRLGPRPVPDRGRVCATMLIERERLEGVLDIRLDARVHESKVLGRWLW